MRDKRTVAFASTIAFASTVALVKVRPGRRHHVDHVGVVGVAVRAGRVPRDGRAPNKVRVLHIEVLGLPGRLRPALRLTQPLEDTPRHEPVTDGDNCRQVKRLVLLARLVVHHVVDKILAPLRQVVRRQRRAEALVRARIDRVAQHQQRTAARGQGRPEKVAVPARERRRLAIGREVTGKPLLSVSCSSVTLGANFPAFGRSMCKSPACFRDHKGRRLFRHADDVAGLGRLNTDDTGESHQNKNGHKTEAGDKGHKWRMKDNKEEERQLRERIT